MLALVSLSRLSVRFIAGPAGWLEDLDPGAPGYNSHSDCVFQGWYVEVAEPNSNNWVVAWRRYLLQIYIYTYYDRDSIYKMMYYYDLLCSIWGR